jgi:hypothetical protein
MRANEVPADICNRLWYLTGGYVGSKDRQRCERSLYEFVRAAWPIIDSSEFEHNWALQAFCEHLEAVTAGQIPRLLANYPPRCAKTTIASICWPVWKWVRQERSFLTGPQVRFLCGSYSAMLSLQNATKARRLILSPWFQANRGHRFVAPIGGANNAGVATGQRSRRLGPTGRVMALTAPWPGADHTQDVTGWGLGVVTSNSRSETRREASWPRRVFLRPQSIPKVNCVCRVGAYRRSQCIRPSWAASPSPDTPGRSG